MSRTNSTPIYRFDENGLTILGCALLESYEKHWDLLREQRINPEAELEEPKNLNEEQKRIWNELTEVDIEGAEIAYGNWVNQTCDLRRFMLDRSIDPNYTRKSSSAVLSNFIIPDFYMGEQLLLSVFLDNPLLYSVGPISKRRPDRLTNTLEATFRSAVEDMSTKGDEPLHTEEDIIRAARRKYVVPSNPVGRSNNAPKGAIYNLMAKRAISIMESEEVSRLASVKELLNRYYTSPENYPEMPNDHLPARASLQQQIYKKVGEILAN